MTSPDFEVYEARCNAARTLATEILPANKATLFDVLAVAGVRTVAIEFDGCGDLGQIEAVTANASDGTEITLPVIDIEHRVVNFDGPSIEARQMPLSGVLEMMAYDLLESTHSGWEDGDGARAVFTFDVAERPITLDYDERYTAYNNSVHEF